jgi:ferredoxin-type protein NapH
MMIAKDKFITINKWALIVAIFVYLIGVFSPLNYLQPGLLFVFFAAFLCLLNKDYLAPKPRAAAHLWMMPVVVTIFTATSPLTAGNGNPLLFLVTLLCGLIPCIMLVTGSSEEKMPRRPRLKIVVVRTIVQTSIFVIWASVTSYAFIHGTRPDIYFWAAFHVITVSFLPVFFGRIVCGWICPNCTLQDGLLKNMTYKRPIKLNNSIEAQSSSCAMNISGKADARAPLFPATLLLAWFPVFFIETIFDLTQKDWWPVVFLYALMFCSLLMPWRKLCTYFCFLSSYRGINCHNSLWRIRYNRSQCKQCKVCQAEKVCPFYIDIRNQDNEMPGTCCLCFSCMEACPFDGVITFKRNPAEKARLSQEAKTGIIEAKPEETKAA